MQGCNKISNNVIKVEAKCSTGHPQLEKTTWATEKATRGGPQKSQKSEDHNFLEINPYYFYVLSGLIWTFSGYPYSQEKRTNRNK